MPDTKRFDVIFEGKGVASGKMRNDISVQWPAMKERFDLATDEGPFHGGDGTAPPPLALFTAALTGCIMTQIRAMTRPTAMIMELSILGLPRKDKEGQYGPLSDTRFRTFKPPVQPAYA